MAWATRLRHSFLTDIFTSTRVRIALLFIVSETLTILLVGIFVDSAIHTAIVDVFGGAGNPPSGETPEEFFAAVSWITWLVRLGILAIFVAMAYFLSEITLRPIKRAHVDQNRFIANVSHELRTPLSILKTNGEVALMMGDRLTREEAIEALRSNIEEVDRLSKIIEFFLNFSSAKYKLDKLNMANVSLSSVASKVTNIFQKSAAQKGVTLTLTNTGPTVVYGNATALEEMLINLVKNAIKFTPKGGSVRVAINDAPHEVILSVKDTGIGIPPLDIPNIYDPFYKGSNRSPNQKKDGIGLGLTIVREIVRMHRALIFVSSKPDKGTTFFVHFPAVRRS